MTSLRAAGASDTGLVRATNQDTLLVADQLYAVADGMGGHAAGEVASATAVSALAEAWTAAGDGTGHRHADALAEAAREANRRVWTTAQADPELRGMGTTLVAVALVDGPSGDELAVVNVGDSRVYRLRSGELEQLTSDHSLVAELVADGQLAAEEAEFHPQRHVLTRALGVDPEVPVDLLTIDPSLGDRLLLCSDGLIREVSDAQVASILRRLADPHEAARELVSEARLRGGSDNITVVLVDVVDDDDRAMRASDALAAGPGPDGESTGATALRPPSAPEADHTVVAVPAADPAAGRDDTGVMAVITSTPSATGLAVPPPAPRQRLVTVRVLGFAVLLLAVVAAAGAGVDLYARGTYYVGVRRGSLLTVYRGRPGGVLWFQPTVVEPTATPLSAVTPYERPTVAAGVLEPSVAAANSYIQRVTAPTMPASPTPSTTAPPSTIIPSSTTPATTAAPVVTPTPTAPGAVQS